MNFQALRKYSFIALPVIFSILLGSFITVLVFNLVSFSQKITDYFNPTIMASENLIRATTHLESHLSEQKVTDPDRDPAFIHFREALELFQKSLEKGGAGHLEQHPDDIFIISTSIIDQVKAGNQESGLLQLTEMKKISRQHYELHIKELLRYKNNIRLITYTIASLCGLILIGGIFMAYREHAIQESLKREGETMAAITALINALEARDQYTRGHSSRVARNAGAIAGKLGFGKQDLKNLELAAIMHDIGKIGMPDNILYKKQKLTDAEYHQMKNHPETGVRIVKELEVLTDIIPGIRFHHERYDGTGYPFGLSGDSIPLSAQCIAIADTFDAMTSTRPYRTAQPIDRSLEEIRKGSDRQWSAKVVAAFFRCYEQNGLVYESTHNQ